MIPSTPDLEPNTRPIPGWQRPSAITLERLALKTVVGPPPCTIIRLFALIPLPLRTSYKCAFKCHSVQSIVNDCQGGDRIAQSHPPQRSIAILCQDFQREQVPWPALELKVLKEVELLVNESHDKICANEQNSAQLWEKMTSTISRLVCSACVFAGVVSAQTPVSVPINSTYSNINSVKPIASDFAGLGFEITSVMPGANGLAPGVHLFDPVNNPQPLALFQQMGIKNLRVGAGTGDGCRTPFPAYADIDDLFHFAIVARLKVIYQFRLINPASCANPGLASINAATAQYIWSHYSANVSALSSGNEDDFHAAHSYCTSESDCTCLGEIGCHCTSGDMSCAHRQRFCSCYS